MTCEGKTLEDPTCFSSKWLFTKGVIKEMDLFYGQIHKWKLWASFKDISSTFSVQQAYNQVGPKFVIDEIFLKLGVPSLVFWQRDQKWNYSKGFVKYKLANGYGWINSKLVLDAKLNKLWRLASKQYTWLSQILSISHYFIKSKKVVYAFSFLLGDLPLG